MDVVGGVLVEGGAEAKILTGIDDHSRFVVCAGVMVRATSRAVCRHFAAAMGRHGVPQDVLTDNGKVFTGRFGHTDTEVLFDRICRENGIDHLLTAPRRPTTTGKIERFHRTLRTEFLTGRIFADLDVAQAELDRWVASYNTERPHSALDMATPASRFTTAEAAPPADTSALLGERSGEDWISRRVAPNGVISIAWQEISCGKHRGGHRVDVHLQGGCCRSGTARNSSRPSFGLTTRRSGRSAPPRRAERATMTDGGVTDQAEPLRHASAGTSQAHRQTRR